MALSNRRTYYFPADESRIVTGLLPTGQHVAFREEQEFPRGYGPTILSAIADLNVKVEREGSIYERDEDYQDVIAEAAE